MDWNNNHSEKKSVLPDCALEESVSKKHNWSPSMNKQQHLQMWNNSWLTLSLAVSHSKVMGAGCAGEILSITKTRSFLLLSTKHKCSLLQRASAEHGDFHQCEWCEWPKGSKILWVVFWQGFLCATKLSHTKAAYLDALGLIGILCQHAGLIVITTFHLDEAVGGVTDTAWQNLLPQHGVDHCALAVGCSVERKKAQKKVVVLMLLSARRGHHSNGTGNYQSAVHAWVFLKFEHPVD